MTDKLERICVMNNGLGGVVIEVWDGNKLVTQPNISPSLARVIAADLIATASEVEEALRD